MSKTLWILGLIPILTAQATLAQMYAQKVTLYRDFNCHGPGLTIQNQYMPNLNTEGWDDVAWSARVTGVWLFYANPEYNVGGNALMQHVFGDYEFCIELFNLPGDTNSMRFAGDPNDYRNNTLTFYQEVNFQGQEEYTMGDLANVYMKEQKSLIITGTSSWTLFDQPWYKGVPRCVEAESITTFDPLFIFDIEEELLIPFSSVRSIRLGCHVTRWG